MEPGETFGITGVKMKGHIFLFLRNHMSYYAFFDLFNSKVILVLKNEFERYSKLTKDSPFGDTRVPMLERIEQVPRSVYDVVMANYENKISEAEVVSLI